MPDEVVRAQAFELVDRHGRLRGAFAVDPNDDAPSLQLYDVDGKVRLDVGVEADGSAQVSLLHADEQPAVTLGSHDGQVVAFFVVAGVAMCVVQARPDGFAVVGLRDKDGRDRVRIQVAADGSGLVALTDDQGVQHELGSWRPSPAV